ncbi:MAG: PAS domain S-box protein [Deltaproteobacteria bacterium]|nr:PAS domain S-box protein [Deltaproteobacteria bacterium]
MEAVSQYEMGRPVDYLERLYRSHYRGAWLRSWACLFMWAFAFVAYQLHLIKINNLAGISASVVFLILMNPALLLILKRFKSQRLSDLFSFIMNLLEIIGYTAVIYFMGGIRALWLSPLYVVLINYIGITGPRKLPFIIAGFCGTVMALAVAMEYMGFLPSQDPVQNLPIPGMHQAAVVVTVAVYLYIVAFVSAYTGDLLKKSKRKLRTQNLELEDKNRRLGLSEQELTKAHQELEVRVEERTAELKKANVQLEREINERLQTERALVESEEKYRLHFESVSDVIYSIDSSYKVFSVSPSVERILGYMPEELVDRPFQDLKILNPDYLEKALDEVMRVFSGERIDSSIYEFFTKDGTKKIGEVSGAPLIRNGSVIAVIAVARDITERKRLEEQLVQSQKMEAIGTLSGGIAHEFNNILGIMLGNTELALMDVPELNPIHDNLREVKKACLRAKDVVRQILSFSRRTEQELRSEKIGHIVKESINFLRSSIPSTIEIRQKIVSDKDIVLTDSTQINQVLINLCTNAFHAMGKEGGILEIKLDNMVIDAQTLSQYPGLKQGRYVKLSVSDTGRGIEPEIIDRIFDPYFTTKEVGKGTGMGLTVVHGIVTNHGGTITVSSEPEKGSSFHVLLPVVEKEVITEEVSVESLPTGDESILFVDDDPSIIAIGRRALERLGYQVVEKTSSIDALELFKLKPKEFDLVITDMTMPNMTGDKLAGELMKIRSDIPIILCTGYSEHISEEKAKEIGIRCFVMKPLVMRDLANTIRKVLDTKY